jgi:hypothetical protein
MADIDTLILLQRLYEAVLSRYYPTIHSRVFF